jgi:pyrroloquinoline quinone (PQQ) biosynthesis protein C
MYITQILQKEVETHEVLDNLWFKRNMETPNRKEFTLWLTQEYFVSINFVNWFFHAAALTYNQEVKIILTKNIWEELGEGDIDKTHVRILEKFLTGLGFNLSELKCLAKTEMYLQRMRELVTTDFLVALGALGPANEYLLKLEYAKVFSIYQQLQNQESLPEQHFFQTNLSADESHSDQLFRLIEKLCDTNEKKARVIRGNLEALNARTIFYEGLNDEFKKMF